MSIWNLTQGHECCSLGLMTSNMCEVRIGSPYFWRRTWWYKGRIAHTSCWSLGPLWCPQDRLQQNFYTALKRWPKSAVNMSLMLVSLHLFKSIMWDVSLLRLEERFLKIPVRQTCLKGLPKLTSSICMHVASQSCPNLKITTRSSSCIAHRWEHTSHIWPHIATIASQAS